MSTNSSQEQVQEKQLTTSVQTPHMNKKKQLTTSGQMRKFLVGPRECQLWKVAWIISEQKNIHTHFTKVLGSSAAAVSRRPSEDHLQCQSVCQRP